jgi:hypothetical protein
MYGRCTGATIARLGVATLRDIARSGDGPRIVLHTVSSSARPRRAHCPSRSSPCRSPRPDKLRTAALCALVLLALHRLWTFPHGPRLIEATVERRKRRVSQDSLARMVLPRSSVELPRSWLLAPPGLAGTPVSTEERVSVCESPCNTPRAYVTNHGDLCIPADRLFLCSQTSWRGRIDTLQKRKLLP